MIYSCFPFNGEFGILKMKMAEEGGIVEKFIITESNMTFSYKKKTPFIKQSDFDKNRVLHINVPISKADITNKRGVLIHRTRRPVQCKQYNYISQVIDINDDDIFLVSDVDEINRRQDLQKIIDAAKKYGYVHVRQWNHIFKINMICPSGPLKFWISSYAVTGKFLASNDFNFYSLRKDFSSVHRKRYKRKIIVVDTNGHHFSYMGNIETIKKKMGSTAFQCVNQRKRAVRNLIRRGVHPQFGNTCPRFVSDKIDERYPIYVLENMSLFKGDIISWV